MLFSPIVCDPKVRDLRANLVCGGSGLQLMIPGLMSNVCNYSLEGESKGMKQRPIRLECVTMSCSMIKHQFSFKEFRTDAPFPHIVLLVGETAKRKACLREFMAIKHDTTIISNLEVIVDLKGQAQE